MNSRHQKNTPKTFFIFFTFTKVWKSLKNVVSETQKQNPMTKYTHLKTNNCDYRLMGSFTLFSMVSEAKYE